MNETSNFTLEDYVRILNQYQELQQENHQLKDRIKKALEITCKILMNNADNRMICDEQEEEYFDWLDRELLKQEKILKGEENE